MLSKLILVFIWTKILFLALVADFFKNGENFLISSWFCGCFSFFLCSEFINNANEDKDTEGNDEEIYDILDEVSIAKVLHWSRQGS